MPNKKAKRYIIEDITRGRYETIINLKPRLKSKITMTVVGFLIIISILTGVFWRDNRSRAQITKFYPSNCLGNWINPSLAEGVPELLLGSEFNDFNGIKAALYDGGNKQLFCGGFDGEIPKNAELKKTTLKIIWAKSKKREIITTLPTDEVVEQVVETPGDLDNKVTTSTDEIASSTKDIIKDKERDISKELDKGSEFSGSVSTEENQNVTEDDLGGVDAETVVDPDEIIMPTVDEDLEEISFWQKIFPQARAQENEEEETSQTDDASDVSEEADESKEQAEDLSEEILAETDEQTEKDQEVIFLEEDNNTTSTDTVSSTVNVDGEVISNNSATSSETTTTPVISTDPNFIDDGFVSNEEFDSEDLFVIKYSLDGYFWQELGTVTWENWQNEFDLSLDSLVDLSNLQISIESQSAAEDNLVVLLDGMYIEVSYEKSELDELDLIDDINPVLLTNDKKIDFVYTDENTDENLIIKTNNETYIGLTRTEVYFSVTNIGDENELVNLQIHFPEDKGEVKKIEKWEENVPYEIDIPEYGQVDYSCEEGWEKENINLRSEEEQAMDFNENEEEQFDTAEFKKDKYQGLQIIEGADKYHKCASLNEIKYCDSLSKDNKNCIIDKVQIGSHKDKKYKRDWQNIELSNVSLDVDQGIVKKLLGKGIKTKPVPNDLKVKKSSVQGYEVLPGETQYFKMEINFPVDSSGEFYIEAIGDKKGYGLLDPWWNSNWTFRKQITIDHDRVGFISNLSSNANSGQTQIVVKDGSLFSASETVVIKDDSNEETGTISSVSSNTLTMQSNLTNSYTTAANAFVKNTTDSVNLSNFPVLINLASDTSLATNAQDDADDIAFTSSDETTQLDHEIEDFNGTTGELQAWVEIPTLSASSDTVIYMYYSNSTCSSQEDVTGTWDSNHKLVHHLDDWTTSTTEDSTSNNNDATKRAANEPNEADGQIGKAQNFDGSNDYDSVTNTVITSPTALTISSWIKHTANGGTYECALHHGSDTTIGNSAYWLGVCVNNRLTATIGARTGVGWAAGQTTTTVVDGQWYHLTASWDGSVVKVYIDGEYDKQYNLSSYSNLTTPTRFGASADGTNYQFNGVVDEMRISTTSRGADWIKTGYNNQNSPSSFYSLGAEVGLSPTTLHNVPFDNEETPDTTPLFEFTAEDQYGTSDLVYQIEWDDNITFSSPTTRTSDTHSGFVNTENGSDTSPFTENQRIRFTIQAGDALSNSTANTAYYWRVRAKHDGGSFGAWTDIQSLRVNSSLDHSQWIQTTSEQFDVGNLSDTQTTSTDSVELTTGIDIKSARGTFTTPATTGNHAVTGVGFRPKAIMFWGVPRTDENAGSDATQFIGFSDGTRNKVSSIKSEDAVNDNGRTQDNYAIHLRSNVSSDLLARATISSFNSDGFTLNYNVATTGYVIHYIAFGGDDLTARVDEKLVSASPLSGLSFAPDIMFLSTAGWTTPANDDTHGIHSYGVVGKSNFWHRGSHQGSNNTTKDSWLTNTACLSQTYNNGVSWQMTSCSLTSDGMSWSGTNGDEFNYLALNLGGNSAKVGTFQKETTGTSGATQDLTGWGFSSDAAIVGFASAGKTSMTRSDHCHFTHGSYDSTNQGMVGMGDANASTASKSIQNNDNAITIINTGAVIQAGGTASQLDDDGVRLTWSPNNTSAYYIGYWAIEGGSALASSGSIMSSPIDYDYFDSATSWGGFDWNENETNGTISVKLHYSSSTDCDTVVPNSALTGNESGFSSGPVDISGMATTTYNRICMQATLTDSGGTPYLQDWTVTSTVASAGSLTTDIVDGSGSSVSTPSSTMSALSLGFGCQTSNGTLGVSYEKIRVSNTTANEQWTLTIAASSTVDTWTTGSLYYDFNDSGGAPAGCGDSGDSDSYAGQMTIDPSVATTTPQGGCSNTGLTLGSQAAFIESSVDTITLLTAGATTDTSCYWDLTGVDIEQTIPIEQASGDYSLDLIITITAS